MTVDEINDIIDLIADGVPNTALKVRNALKALSEGAGVSGDVKEIDVSNAYIAANFDVTGLGTNERLGWAICNGNNGTRNRSGRVSLQYDATNYPTLGAIGGSKDAVVVSHSHYNGIADGQNGIFVYGGTSSGLPGSATFGIDNYAETLNYQGNTSTSGESGANKNMQPYIVTLFIMKL